MPYFFAKLSQSHEPCVSRHSYTTASGIASEQLQVKVISVKDFSAKGKQFCPLWSVNLKHCFLVNFLRHIPIIKIQIVVFYHLHIMSSENRKTNHEIATPCLSFSACQVLKRQVGAH